jgi:hypothetical protein
MKYTIEISDEAIKACCDNQKVLKELVDIIFKNAASSMLKSIQETEELTVNIKSAASINNLKYQLLNTYGQETQQAQTKAVHKKAIEDAFHKTAEDFSKKYYK